MYIMLGAPWIERSSCLLAWALQSTYMITLLAVSEIAKDIVLDMLGNPSDFLGNAIRRASYSFPSCTVSRMVLWRWGQHLSASLLVLRAQTDSLNPLESHSLNSQQCPLELLLQALKKLGHRDLRLSSLWAMHLRVFVLPLEQRKAFCPVRKCPTDFPSGVWVCACVCEYVCLPQCTCAGQLISTFDLILDGFCCSLLCTSD